MTEAQTCPQCGHLGNGRFCPKCGVRLGLALEAAGAQTHVDVAEPPGAVQPIRPAQGPVPVTQVQPGGVIGQTHGVAFTDKVHDVLAQTQEALVWQGKPSLALLVGLVIRYFVLVCIAAFLPFDDFFVNLAIVGVLMALGGLQLLVRFLKLRSTKYRISTERIEVTRGVLSRATDTYEAHQVKDIAIRRPFPISFLGASHLEVSGQGWWIRVLGVPADHAEAIRDAVREAGRREGARAELIQWR